MKILKGFGILMMSLNVSVLGATRFDSEQVDKKVTEILNLHKPVVASAQSGSAKFQIPATETLTPPFPSAWPQRYKSFVYYGYFTQSARVNGIADGDHVYAPWGAVILKIKNQVGYYHYQTFKNRPMQAKLQGVEPVSPKEYEALAQKPLDLLLKKDESKIKLYYCAWIDLNGVIADPIKVKHLSFFKWLRCP